MLCWDVAGCGQSIKRIKVTMTHKKKKETQIVSAKTVNRKRQDDEPLINHERISLTPDPGRKEVLGSDDISL